MFTKTAIGVISVTLLFMACNRDPKNRINHTKHTDTIATNIDTIRPDSNLAASDETYLEEEYNRIALVSEDGRVKLASGNSSSVSGSVTSYSNISFTNSKGEKYVTPLGENTYGTGLHAIKKADGGTYYIVKWFCEGTEGLSAYTIVQDTFQWVSVMDGKAKTNAWENNIELHYDYADWYEKTSGFGYDWTLTYDSKNQNLYIPQIDEASQVTDRYEVFLFNGHRFVSQGVQPHRNLYKSLSNYNHLVLYFTTHDYIIRIDSLNNTLRYASWEKPKTMSDRPDIILNGGRRHNYQGHDEFTFVNGDHEYIVNRTEATPSGDGVNDIHQFLLIQCKGTTLLKQERQYKH